MKWKIFKKSLAGLLTMAMMVGMIVVNVGAQLCDEWWGGDGVGLGIVLYIQPCATSNIFLTMDEVYRSVERPGGWDNIQITGTPWGTRTISAKVTTGQPPTGPPPANQIPVRVFGNSTISDAGGVMPRDIHGNWLPMNGNWTHIDIEMNSNASFWIKPHHIFLTLNQTREKAAHIFMHEVGHVFKLRHPWCLKPAVMFPDWLYDYTNPFSQYSRSTVQVHDLFCLIPRWITHVK